ncbi:type 4a pilus biogenesis protein PilO [uncultured Thermosynechococcus sp.]|uniref:type 4a pilus biogenesis protein PilO n=1 Tax=uncultured Thermosynechococcus sp. TaxID=436945 RepID=UPI00262789DE|nr:pilus assembly protein PilO [uncultured Thermosynechococcus sp.]
MTLTGDFGGSPIEESAPNYPTVFGITLTPVVSGGLIAVLGLGAAVYFGNLSIAPKLEAAAKLQEEITQQENELSQREVLLKQLNDVVRGLERAKQENRDVRSLFATQEALDTLLLDISRLILKSGARLNTFEPDSAASGIVQDGSLGPELNAKLKRQTTNITVQGPFPSIIQVMEEIDRQQNFLVINNLTMELVADKPGEVIATFKLMSYVPLTPEEIAALAPPPQEGQPQGGEQQGQPQQK